MTARFLRIVVVLVATCLALGSGLVAPTLGTGPTTATGTSTVTGSIASTGATLSTESVASVSITSSPSVIDAGQVTRSAPVIAAGARADRVTRDRSPGERSSRQGALPAPFAQADDDDEEARVINITAPGDNVEYTLTAPDLEPTDSVEVGENAEDAANPETVRGNTASGTIGNGAYDAYRFTGPADAVRLESDDIDDLEVMIDGEPVDPRTLTGDGTETTTTTATTAEPTTTRTTTETTETEATTTGTEETTLSTTRETTGSTSAATTDTTSTDAATTDASDPTTATTTDTSGSESGQSGFGIVMFVLIGVVSGLVLAGALAYVVGSDRFG